MRLASNFRNPSMIRSDRPLTDDQIARAVPSIFAQHAHESRSERYTYIPTIDVLNGLRREGFEPFMVCQTRVRKEDRKDHTKHMIRLRHASRIMDKEANEIILLNSHDGSSSYQMMGGVFRFVCHNGLVCGDDITDFRVRHSGDVVGQVIEGCYQVLDQFEMMDEQRDTMKQLRLRSYEQEAFAEAALAYRFEEGQHRPITASQILQPWRAEDRSDDLWMTFNRVQENLIKGGIRGRNQKGRPTRTRAVNGIDQDVKLNRALWVLAEALRSGKAAA
ncbi:DUF932 domain-containing protein [Pseudomonas aeruginosa]